MQGDTYQLTATQIAEAVRSGKLTAIEVAEAFLNRTDSLNPQMQAFTAFDRDYVGTQAAAIDQSNDDSLLKGVPVGVKDVFNTEFYPTEKGSGAWKGYKAGNDARCVSYLRDHGGVVFGKTDTAELAVHASSLALNPHNRNRVTGSSSSGSAAAVAAGLVPVALGTQTGGSTIRPGSWCGVYAMKPSFGLIPRTGVLKTTDTLDTIGFFGREAADLELMLDVLRIRGRNFPLQEKRLEEYRQQSDRPIRVAIVGAEFLGDVTAYAADALKGVRDQFSGEVEFVEVSLPAQATGFQDLHRRVYHPCLAYYLKTEMDKAPAEVSDTLRAIFDDAKSIPPTDFAGALREQSELADSLEALFREQKLDFIFALSSNGSAPEREPDKHFDLNQLWTMAWLPVVNVPQFQGPDGMPFGLAVVGPKFSDYKILSFLKRCQAKKITPQQSVIAGCTDSVGN